MCESTPVLTLEEEDVVEEEEEEDTLDESNDDQTSDDLENQIPVSVGLEADGSVNASVKLDKYQRVLLFAFFG